MFDLKLYWITLNFGSEFYNEILFRTKVCDKVNIMNLVHLFVFILVLIFLSSGVHDLAIEKQITNPVKSIVY